MEVINQNVLDTASELLVLQMLFQGKQTSRQAYRVTLQRRHHVRRMTDKDKI